MRILPDQIRALPAAMRAQVEAELARPRGQTAKAEAALRFPEATVAPRKRSEPKGATLVSPEPQPSSNALPAGKATILRMNPSKDEIALNKTERAYLDLLRQAGHDWIGIQCWTLKLGDDCRYTPDFWTLRAGELTAHEVKGFFRDDAKVKIKVAARLYPFLRFVVVMKRKGGGWDITPLLP